MSASVSFLWMVLKNNTTYNFDAMSECFIHLFHCYLCSTASATHEINIIMSLSNFKELWALVYSSIQKFDNDYAFFFMGYHSVSVNYK